MGTTTEAISAEAPPSDAYLAKESKNIAKGGIIIVLGTLVAQGLSMVATLWIARLLGPDKFGVISLALSLLLPLAALGALGLNSTLVRFIPVHIGKNENDRVTGVLGSAFLMAGMASMLITAVVFILAPLIANQLFTEPRLEPVLRLLALSIPLIVLTNIATAATRGSKLMHFDAIVQMVGPLFRILIWGIGLLLITNLFDVAIYASLFQWLFSAIVALGFTFWVFRKYFGNGIRWSFKPLWIYSAPLILSTLMYTLAPRMDRLVLGVVSDSRAVGVYSIAASLVLVLTLAHSSIVKTFLPIVADAYNRVSIERAKTLYVTVTRWDARLTFAIVVGAVLIAQEVLGLLGERYAEALIPFIILAVAVYFGAIPGPTGAFLQMTNQQRVEAANAVIFFVLSPIVQLGLAIWLGWIGVAIGVLVMAIIINLVQIGEIKYFYDFHPLQQDHLLFTVLSIMVVSVCAVVGVTQELPIRLALLVVVVGGFFIFIYIFRTPNDELIFNTMINGTPLGKIKGRPS